MTDYSLLACGEVFYLGKEYKSVELPWIVEDKYVMATLPDGKNPFRVGPGWCLLGSAEQAFLSIIDKEAIIDHKLLAITPCFRDETEYTDLTKQYFMKLELIHINPLHETYEELITDAEEFFAFIGIPVRRVKTDIGEDLYYNDIELGSYGLRSWKQNIYAYGTGVAEPRTSYCLKLSTCE